MAREGVPLIVIQRQLGHTSASARAPARRPSRASVSVTSTETLVAGAERKPPSIDWWRVLELDTRGVGLPRH